jgi:hypothetical protein
MFGKIKQLLPLTLIVLGGCRTPGYYTPSPVPSEVSGFDARAEFDKVSGTFSHYGWSFPAPANATLQDYGLAEVFDFSGASLIVFPRNWTQNNFQLWFLSGSPQKDRSIFEVGNSVELEKYDKYVESVASSQQGQFPPLGALGIKFGQTKEETKNLVDQYCRAHSLTAHFTIDDDTQLVGFIDNLIPNRIVFYVFYHGGKLYSFFLWAEGTPRLGTHKPTPGADGMLKRSYNLSSNPPSAP